MVEVLVACADTPVPDASHMSPQVLGLRLPGHNSQCRPRCYASMWDGLRHARVHPPVTQFVRLRARTQANCKLRSRVQCAHATRSEASVPNRPWTKVTA